jgi:hypothetical protein
MGGTYTAEQLGGGEKETRKAWNDVGEQFSELGRRFGEHYRKQGRDGGAAAEEQRQALNDAFRNAVDQLDQAFTSVGDALRDPETKKTMNRAVRSLGDAPRDHVPEPGGRDRPAGRRERIARRQPAQRIEAFGSEQGRKRPSGFGRELMVTGPDQALCRAGVHWFRRTASTRIDRHCVPVRVAEQQPAAVLPPYWRERTDPVDTPGVEDGGSRRVVLMEGKDGGRPWPGKALKGVDDYLTVGTSQLGAEPPDRPICGGRGPDKNRAVSVKDHHVPIVREEIDESACERGDGRGLTESQGQMVRDGHDSGPIRADEIPARCQNKNQPSESVDRESIALIDKPSAAF